MSTLTGSPPLPPPPDGAVQVSAVDAVSGNSQNTIILPSDGLSKQEIEQQLQKAREKKEEDAEVVWAALRAWFCFARERGGGGAGTRLRGRVEWVVVATAVTGGWKSGWEAIPGGYKPLVVDRSGWHG